MSGSLSLNVRNWRRRPVVTCVGEARDGSRMAVTGTIRRVERIAIGPSYCCFCQLDDGTGQIGLLFVNQSTVPGMEIGVRCHVEGRARPGGHGLQMWNSAYQMEPPGDGTE